jgi:deoxyadenosine/deoxycytidine kinase
MSQMPTIISIEGNIGTGKSEMVNLLKEHYKNNENITFVLEPVDKWLKMSDEDGNILSKFYNDQERWSYTFQKNAFITRIQDIIAHSNSKVIVVERSVYTDRNVFATLLREDNKISKMEWDLYTNWFN